MDIKTFAEQVFMMREAQKAYFRERKPSDLNYSKLMEKHVDNCTEEILHPDRNQNQTNLFNS